MKILLYKGMAKFLMNKEKHRVSEAQLRTFCITNSPFGDKVTAGIECILGSAIYLKSTGMSLKIKIALSEQVI